MISMILRFSNIECINLSVSNVHWKSLNLLLLVIYIRAVLPRIRYDELIYIYIYIYILINL